MRTIWFSLQDHGEASYIKESTCVQKKEKLGPLKARAGRFLKPQENRRKLKTEENSKKIFSKRILNETQMLIISCLVE